MSTSQELFDVDQVLFRQEELILEATERLAAIMEKNNVTKAELARRLGKSKAYVTQCLNGRCNLTLRTIADLFGALDYKVILEPRMCTEHLYRQICTIQPSDAWLRSQSRARKQDFQVEEPAEIAQASTFSEAA